MFLIMDKGKTLGPMPERDIYDAFNAGAVTEESLACAYVHRVDWRPPTDLRFWKPLRIWFPKILELPKPQKPKSIEFLCLGCGTTIRVPHQGTGGTLKCPTCGIRLKISLVKGEPCVEKVQEQSKATPIKSGEPVTPNQVLGVGLNCTYEELKAAYRRKLKKYHPDRVADMGVEIQSLAETKTKEINSAYEQLCKNRNFV
jgi:hypothetical protein